MVTFHKVQQKIGLSHVLIVRVYHNQDLICPLDEMIL